VPTEVPLVFLSEESVRQHRFSWPFLFCVASIVVHERSLTVDRASVTSLVLFFEAVIVQEQLQEVPFFGD